MKSVLTIAGSDPSGGAGIQADLRVFAALSVAGLSAITALTVQNSEGVRSVHPVDADVLRAQIEAVLEDATDLGAVKIGMLGGAAQVRVVAEMLRRFRPPNVVLDPVLASSGGVPLLDEEGRKVLLEELLPLCDLITPNLLEAATLTGMTTVATRAEMRTAARRFFARGARAVLIKGGHSEGAPIDALFQRALLTPKGALTPKLFRGNGVRIDTKDSHGTGCVLSASIAANLPKYAAMFDQPFYGRKEQQVTAMQWAISPAKKLVTQALKQPILWGKGRGYPNVLVAHPPYLPLPLVPHDAMRGLYVITDAGLQLPRTHIEVAETALAGGAKIIQLRDKSLSMRELISLAGVMQRICREANATFIVNDHIDVALAVGADGVHLGPDDMHPRDARRLLGPDAIIGISVSSVEEAQPLAPYASYIAVGAIFGSATKSDAGDAIGVERIREIKTAFPDKPIVAIGGINSGNIDAVIAAGADAAAVISAVVCAPDMEAATRELVSHFPATNRPAEVEKE